MHRLELRATPYEGVSGSRWVTPVVDGVPLTELVAAFEEAADDVFEPVGGYAGIVVGPTGEPLARELLRGGPRVAVLGCVCGDTGCWPLEAEVRVGDDAVSWQRFRQPHRPERDHAGFGPFVFDRQAYRAAVVAALGH